MTGRSGATPAPRHRSPSHLVPADSIETIIGRRRHPTDHIARRIGQTVYILHPVECRESGHDLRACDYSRALHAYLATLLPGEPKPGETWELTSPDPKVDPWRATVVVIDGLSCLAWRNDAGPHICPLGAYGPRMRRKIADAPSVADQ